MATPLSTPLSTADDWPFEVRALAPTIGAELHGIDLSQELPDATIAAVRAALLRYRVIFFREQAISTEEHIAFARRFGELEIHPFTENKPDFPEVILLRNGPENRSRINVWHSDVTWRKEPSLGSVLRARVVPEVGGDTLWADMVGAYTGLSDELQQRISGLFAIHDFTRAFGGRLSQEEFAAMREKYPVSRHPVVRTHPETGEKALYVNAAFTHGIEGMSEKESNELLGHLYMQARVPELQVRFRWRQDSIAFWDNRSAQHYPVSDYFPAVRSMERVTIVGDRPS